MHKPMKNVLLILLLFFIFSVAISGATEITLNNIQNLTALFFLLLMGWVLRIFTLN